MPNTKPTPILTETIAVRLTQDECRALAAIARSADRTISYIIRAQLREFLRQRQSA
jgi:predicted transcriptional regulator